MLEARPAGAAVRALARWRRRPSARERGDVAARATRILILKPHDQLGDFLLITPALRALRERYADAEIALATREFLAPLAERFREVDRVWVLPRLTGPASLAAWWSVVSGLTGFRPDLAFVMNSVSRSKSADMLAVVSRPRLIVGRARVFAGPLPDDAPQDPAAGPLAQPPSDPIYDLDVAVGRSSAHQSDRLLDLVRWCTSPNPSAALHLDLSDADRAAGRARVDAALGDPGAAKAPIVGLHPGAANELKCWPLESFVALGVELVAHAAPAPRLVVFESPRERGRGAAVVAGLAARGVAAGLVPAAGIESFAAACAELALLACNDSGVMHIAAALGIPTVSFHSLGNPREWGPRGDRAIAFHAPGGIAAIPVTAALAAARALLEIDAKS